MPNSKTIAELTVEVVTTFLNNHQIDLDEVPTLIKSTHEALSQIAWTREIGNGTSPARLQILPDEKDEDGHFRNTMWRYSAPALERPAVPVERSVTPDWIICLEDGKRYKILKGALRAKYNMSPEQYRRRWNLPIDYPMVAPNYSEKRKKISKQFGLGKDITRPRGR